jgi:hypothetical protein
MLVVKSKPAIFCRLYNWLCCTRVSEAFSCGKKFVCGIFSVCLVLPLVLLGILIVNFLSYSCNNVLGCGYFSALFRFAIARNKL